MKTSSLILILFTLLTGSIFLEDYWCRGAGILVGFIVILIGFLITTLSEDFGHHLTALGAINSILFFAGLGLTLHVNKKTGKVRSAFYTHVIDEGKLETKRLKPYYTVSYSRFDTEIADFIFVYHRDSVTLYSQYQQIMKIDSKFSIREHDFGHGKLHYIDTKAGLYYDLRGHPFDNVTEFVPEVRDITPDYTNSANI